MRDMKEYEGRVCGECWWYVSRGNYIAGEGSTGSCHRSNPVTCAWGEPELRGWGMYPMVDRRDSCCGEFDLSREAADEEHEVLREGG